MRNRADLSVDSGLTVQTEKEWRIRRTEVRFLHFIMRLIRWFCLCLSCVESSAAEARLDRSEDLPRIHAREHRPDRLIRQSPRSRGNADIPMETKMESEDSARTIRIRFNQ